MGKHRLILRIFFLTEYGIKSNPLVSPIALEKKEGPVKSYSLFSLFPVLLVISKFWKPVC